MLCPRCCKNEAPRVELRGMENGTVVWTLYYCERCNYSFRDTEEEAVLNPKKRKAIFQVDPDHKERYAPMMPKPAD
jgi:C4-type Zn-finger protein